MIADQPPAIIQPAPGGIIRPREKHFDPFLGIALHHGFIKPQFPAVSLGTILTNNQTADSTTTTFATLTTNITSTTYGIFAFLGRSGSPLAVSTVQLGGVDLIPLFGFSNSTNVGAFYASPVRGMTGSLVVTWSATVVRSLACCWPVSNLRSLYPTGTATSTTDPLNAAINCEAGGAILGFAYDGGGAAQTMNWTNLTERFDTNIESTACFSGASDTFASAVTARSITADPVNASNQPSLGLIAIR